MTIKIADFGLSKTRDLSNVPRTKSNAIIGSVPWAAPEYLDPTRFLERSEKGDIFSFAVILWELITRQIPWKGIASDKLSYEVSRDEKRLPIPVNRDKEYKSVFEKCWNNGKRSPSN